MKSDLAGQYDRGQILFDGDVSIGISLHHFAILDVSVPHPLAQSWAEIFQQVGFCKFSSLSVAKSSHSFSGSYHMDRVKVDFDPLTAILPYHVSRAPCASILVYPYPDKIQSYNTVF